MFGGYGRYFVTVDEDEAKRAGDPRYARWSAGDNYVSSRLLVFLDNDIAALFGAVPAGLAERLAEMRRQISGERRPLINVLREVDAANYMPGAVLAKVDRMSMQHSLEVRAPLLGRDVAAFAAGLAGESCYRAGQGKLVLKRVDDALSAGKLGEPPEARFRYPGPSVGQGAAVACDPRPARRSRCAAAVMDRAPAHCRYLDRLEDNFHAYQCWGLFSLETWLRSHRAEPAPNLRLWNAAAALWLPTTCGRKVAWLRVLGRAIRVGRQRRVAQHGVGYDEQRQSAKRRGLAQRPHRFLHLN